jgi:sugar O-acyltransferase (sialic acid O-acetyltransferase NeuD family)
MRDLVIFGATELAGMARYCAMEEHGRNIAAFVVDAGYRTHEHFHGIPVIEWPEIQPRFTPANTDCFIALGYRAMRRRRAVYEQVRGAGYGCVNLVSPTSHVANSTHMGENNLILPGVVIEPGVQLGANNVIWSNATICHDTVVGSHNFLAANVTLGGHARLGDANFIGFSATVLQNIAIGNETLIGAQTLVRQSTRDLHQYWGVPASERGAIDAELGVCVE